MPHILVSCSNSEPASYMAALQSVGFTAEYQYCPVLKDSPLAKKYPDRVYDFDQFDGLLLCGGGDMDPAYFHQENAGSEDIDLIRDETELELFRRFFEAGKPILGICRGHQVINVALGGDLIQHIGDTLCIFHRHSSDHAGDKAHAVYSADASWLRDTYGKVFTVNSSHHQAVGRPGEGLEAILWSESGIVEALQHKTYPLVSVQFHPERMMLDRERPDTVSGKPVFEHFLAYFPALA